MTRFGRFFFLLSAAFVVSASSLSGQGTLYVATGSNGTPGSLYTVDQATGASSLIGAITNASGGGAIGVTGLAFNPLADTLYGITVNSTSNGNTVVQTLVTIDPNTAVATIIGSLGSAPLSDISFAANGTLYGYRQQTRTLVTVNLSTGATTAVGGSSGLTATYGGGLAFNSAGTLYLSATGAADDPSLVGHQGLLDRLNPSTGALITPRGPTLTGAPFTWAINALAFDGNGVLYGSNNDGMTIASSADLITIDLVTGAVSELFVLPNNTDAIAFRLAPIPEPSTAGLIGLGAASLIAVFIYRRRG